MRCIDRSNTPVTWTRRKRFRMKQDEFIPHAQTLSLCSSLLENFGCSGWTPIKQTETHGCVLHSGIFVAGQRRAIHKDVVCFCDSARPACWNQKWFHDPAGIFRRFARLDRELQRCTVKQNHRCIPLQYQAIEIKSLYRNASPSVSPSGFEKSLRSPRTRFGTPNKIQSRPKTIHWLPPTNAPCIENA